MSMEEKKPLVVVVDGCIGAGKSTYIAAIKKFTPLYGVNCVFIPEPVEGWKQCGILQRFYSDPSRWAYHFQTKAFHDRVKLNIEMYKTHGNTPDLYILERSPFTDNLFMEILHESGSVDDLEMQHYKEWWELWNQVMPYTPDVFIYLRPSIDVCMNRIKIRHREGEEGVSKEYQLLLQSKHDDFFRFGKVKVTSDKEVPVHTLDSEKNFKDDEGVQLKITEQFLGFVYGE